MVGLRVQRKKKRKERKEGNDVIVPICMRRVCECARVWEEAAGGEVSVLITMSPHSQPPFTLPFSSLYVHQGGLGH